MQSNTFTSCIVIVTTHQTLYVCKMYSVLHHISATSLVEKKPLTDDTSDTIPAIVVAYLGILVPVCDTVKNITQLLQMASPKRITCIGAFIFFWEACCVQIVKNHHLTALFCGSSSSCEKQIPQRD